MSFKMNEILMVMAIKTKITSQGWFPTVYAIYKVE